MWLGQRPDYRTVTGKARAASIVGLSAIALDTLGGKQDDAIAFAFGLYGDIMWNLRHLELGVRYTSLPISHDTIVSIKMLLGLLSDQWSPESSIGHEGTFT